MNCVDEPESASAAGASASATAAVAAIAVDARREARRCDGDMRYLRDGDVALSRERRRRYGATPSRNRLVDPGPLRLARCRRGITLDLGRVGLDLLLLELGGA